MIEDQEEIYKIKENQWPNYQKFKVKSIKAFILGRISYFKWNCREISLMLGGIQLIPIP